jgi:hypothetical protein
MLSSSPSAGLLHSRSDAPAKALSQDSLSGPVFTGFHRFSFSSYLCLRSFQVFSSSWLTEDGSLAPIFKLHRVAFRCRAPGTSARRWGLRMVLNLCQLPHHAINLSRTPLAIRGGTLAEHRGIAAHNSRSGAQFFCLIERDLDCDFETILRFWAEILTVLSLLRVLLSLGLASLAAAQNFGHQISSRKGNASSLSSSSRCKCLEVLETWDHLRSVSLVAHVYVCSILRRPSIFESQTSQKEKLPRNYSETTPPKDV